MADGKKCCRCGVVRTLEQFCARKENRDGLRGYCKPCDARQAQEKRAADRGAHNKYRREYYRKNPEPAKRQALDWARRNPERKYETLRAWVEKNREKMTGYYRKSWLKKYRMTPDDFESMYAAQNGACGICKEPASETLCVDHCHDTGKVRGLLCRKCNSGIGMLKDDAEVAAQAAEYLMPTSLQGLVSAAMRF